MSNEPTTSAARCTFPDVEVLDPNWRSTPWMAHSADHYAHGADHAHT